MAYDPQLAHTVCDLLAENEVAKSLRQACAIVGLAPSTFLLWCDNDGELAEHYARAVKISTDMQFEQFGELNDVEPPLVEGRVDAGWVAWNRQRLDNKKWEMAKRRPSKYSEKVTHAGDPENPIDLVVHRIAAGE